MKQLAKFTINLTFTHFNMKERGKKWNDGKLATLAVICGEKPIEKDSERNEKV